MNELLTHEITGLTSDLKGKELFNILQTSKPIHEIVEKPFKISGVDTMFIEVEEENGEKAERLKLILFTDLGVYHTYAVTFIKSLEQATKYVDIKEETFILHNVKDPKNGRNYYNLEIL